MLKHHNVLPALVLGCVLALGLAEIPLLFLPFRHHGYDESLKRAEIFNMIAFGLSTLALMVLMGFIARIYKFVRNLEPDSVIVRSSNQAALGGHTDLFMPRS